MKCDYAQNYFAQVSDTAAGDNTNRPDTPILDRLVAAPCEVLAIWHDTPILDGLVAAQVDLLVACSSSDDETEDETVSHNWMAQHLNRRLVSAQYYRVYGSPPKAQLKGRDSIFAQISRVFPEINWTMIKNVVRETFGERIGINI